MDSDDDQKIDGKHMEQGQTERRQRNCEQDRTKRQHNMDSDDDRKIDGKHMEHGRTERC